ncbi:MAG: hypothetical protein LBL47_04900 [Lactobacillus sp.]|jgi:hypothetical protein|nr:hypothetical protein [Lactobacillus sp.]
MLNLTKKVFSGLAILLVASCGLFMDPVPEESTPVISSTIEPIQLKVRSIDVVSEFAPTFTRPNIEHLLPVSIERNARAWARERLEAVEPHSTKVATFIIKDASMTEEFEKSDSILRKDRNNYRATLSIVLKIADTEKVSSAETSTTVWKELGIPADLTIEHKEAHWNRMIREMFEQFNEAMTNGVEKNLGQYVR